MYDSVEQRQLCGIAGFLPQVGSYATITYMEQLPLPGTIKLRLWSAIFATLAVVALNVLLTQY